MTTATSPIDLSPLQRAQRIKAKAIELGFDLVGITAVEQSKHTDYFRKWLDQGRAGEMTYLADRFDERTHPAAYFPDARSAVCVAISYHVPSLEAEPQQTPAASPAMPAATTITCS